MNESSEDYKYSYQYDLEYGDIEELQVTHQQTDPVHIVSVVVCIISVVFGLIGNGAVIWVTAFKSKKTINSIWLLNLAIADFVFVLFLTVYIDYILRDFHWNFGKSMCKINSFVSAMNMYASVLFLTMLSVDRYVSLVHLNWSQKYRKIHFAWIVCGCIWVIAAILSCPALIFRDIAHLGDRVLCFNNFLTQDKHKAAMIHVSLVVIRNTVGFLLPFAAISVTGILLSVKVKQSNGSVRMSRFSKMVIVVILAFFFCWAPFHIFTLMELSIHSSDYFHHILSAGFPIVTSLGFFNSCINPLLYMLLSKKVRHILKRSCLNITKSSLRELSQSISATEIESGPGAHQDSVPDDSLALSAL